MAPPISRPKSFPCGGTHGTVSKDADSPTGIQSRNLPTVRRLTLALLLLSLIVLTQESHHILGKRFLPPGRKIHLAALLPVNNSRFPFAYQKVLPALKMSVENVTAVGGPLHGRVIEVHFRNSECSSAASMNQMYNFYIRKQVDAFFGPCCDYAAAPVARQLHYWNLPMLTAGAIASDFAAGKRKFFNQITRVGSSVNSLVDCLLGILQQFGWRRIKQVYDPVAQDLIGEKVCHIMVDGIHYGLKYQRVVPDIEQDYEKVDIVEDFLERMPEEIGDWGSSCGHSLYGQARINPIYPTKGVEFCVHDRFSSRH